MDADRLICKEWNVRADDTLPFKGRRHSVTRNDLHKIWAQLGYTEGAEIGVGTGRHAIQMLNAIPDLHLYAIDPWEAYFRCSQELCDKRYNATVSRLKDKNATVMRTTSLEAVQGFKHGSLDFVYIDGDHRFDAVMMDLIVWAPKVRVGGMVALHDFYPFYQAGVMDAVYAYTRAHNINSWYVTWEKEATACWMQRENYADNYA